MRRRDATNPTFRKIRLSDVLGVHGARKRSLKMETGAFYIDMTKDMR
jgi:hypothetical protein